MNKDKHVILIILISFMTLLSIWIAIYKFFNDFNEIEFEKVGEYQVREVINLNSYSDDWKRLCFTVHNSKLFKWNNEDKLKTNEEIENYSIFYVDVENILIENLDLYNYTYIISYEHELIDVKYKRENIYFYLFSSYSGYYTFDSKIHKNRAFIYRVKGIGLSIDPFDDKRFKIIDSNIQGDPQ